MKWLLVPILCAGASAQGSLAAWEVTPPHAALGQPIECRLVVTHEAGATPIAPRLNLDYAWEILEGPELETTSNGTVFLWTVMAFEAGEVTLPAMDVGFEAGDRLLSASKTVTVEGVLGANEDAPRPGPEFRTVEERTSPVRPLHLGALFLLGCLAAGFACWWHLRRLQEQDAEPDEWERLAGLTEVEPVPVAVELSALVRSAFDRHEGTDRSALTDYEWLADLHPGAAADAREVLARCERIKFAGERPTRLAIEDLKRRSSELIEPLRPTEVPE